MAVTLTEEEIDLAREAAGETSYSLVEARVAALNDAQALRLQDLVARWGKAANKFAKVTGKVDVDYGRNRAEIRARVRSLLGLAGATSSSGSSASGGTVSVGNEFSW